MACDSIQVLDINPNCYADHILRAFLHIGMRSVNRVQAKLHPRIEFGLTEFIQHKRINEKCYISHLILCD